MPQPTDIILNSAGYMIQPGSPQSPGYKRLQDGHPEGLTQRTSITDFFGGQRRTHQLERDRFYDSLNIGPALQGQGVTPWAHSSDNIEIAPIATHLPNLTTPIPHVVIRDRLYFAIGTRLYAGPLLNAGGQFATFLKTYDHPITDITIYGSIGILIAFGSADDIIFRHTITNTEATLFAGERAHRIQAYAGYAIWIDARTAATPTILRMVTGTGIDSRHVSYDVTDIIPVGGQLMLITKQALFTFSGRVQEFIVNGNPDDQWVGEFTPFYQQGVYTGNNDFSFITGYGGRTIAWIAGGVHELVPSGERAGWRSTGLSGRRCFGGCVAAGYVIVSIESHTGNNELWAYNGNGWWCIARQPMPTGNGDGTWCWPMDIGVHTNNAWNLFVFISGTNTIRLIRLSSAYGPSGTLQFPYAADAQWVSPLLDAADRDKLKAWRKVGAVFSSPERRGNLASTDQVSVALDYSIDGGETWTLAAQQTGITGNSLENMNFDLEAALQGVVSRFIMLRIEWASISDWAPILTGIWVEHEALASPARRRKWQLKIHARDQEIDRDGVVLTRTGRQLIEELWNAWETDTPLTFRDIDYDTDPTQRTVRIVGISEHVQQPYDHGKWGDSLITLNLVEV